MNAAGGSQAGATDEEIAAVLEDPAACPSFTKAELLAFQLADAACQLPADVPDELFAELQQHYSNEELVELAAIIALENFRSRFNRVFRIEPNGFYCALPQREASRPA